MRKPTITRTWIAGAVAMAAGFVAVAVGLILMLAYGGTWNQAFDSHGYDFTPAFNGPFWAGVAALCVGGVIAFAGWIVQIIGWVGAMTNSYRLPEKNWFTIVLVGGLAGFAFGPIGFAAMLAYIMAAPEGMDFAAAGARGAPTTLQPTS